MTRMVPTDNDVVKPDEPVKSIRWSASVVDKQDEELASKPRRYLSLMLSSIYGVFIFTMGATFCAADRALDNFHVSEIFSILVAAAGVLWLAILHVDVLWHKHSASRRVRPSQSGLYAHSTASVFRMQAKKTSAPRLWFLIGRHSGSFYLKGGMVVFCFCHLVNEGLILQDTVNNMRIEGQTVRDTLKIAFHVLRPIYSFYQLFIAFKYSNIVINHAFTASRFGMMHLIGTCLYFWFSSIVQEYHHSTHGDYKHGNRTILDFTSVTLYLQPFTIEYQIILAGVWYIVWQNIGTDPPGQTRRQSEGGEAKYHSNLVVSADCHAANKGLFAGIFLLLCAIVSLVIEQVAFSSPAYHSVETIIFLAQNTALVVIALLAVVWGYKQISTLDLNTHPITLLDDVLLYVPLPFYFVYYIVTIIADMWYESYTLLTSHVVTVIQVVLQTLFLSDGLRRCSNSRRQKFTKPGRETVTFLIVCNIAIWVTNTFQTEKPHLNNYMRMCFGESAWVMVKHSTLPLMLFYRFHSSVCLADIWKSAYESDIAL
ncbi:proton channel OtopLc-like isoform X3 [Ornithodoros turicata]